MLNYKYKVNILKNCRKLKESIIVIKKDFWFLPEDTRTQKRTLKREAEDRIAYPYYCLFEVRSKKTLKVKTVLSRTRTKDEV